MDGETKIERGLESYRRPVFADNVIGFKAKILVGRFSSDKGLTSWR